MEQKDNLEIMREYDALYRRKMYHVAQKILKNVHDAEDAVQEAFIKLFKKSNDLPPPSSDTAKSYALTAIKSASIDLYRKRRRENEHTLLTDTISESSGTGQNTSLSSDKLWSTQLNSMGDAQELIQCLPESYRSVLDCRFLQELSVKKTAELLSLKEGTVRKRQERGLKILKKRMGGEGYEI